MLPRLDYLALCRSIQLLLLLAHSESAKDLELPEELKDEVRELLVTLGEDPTARPLLAHGFIDRFGPVDDAAYDDIRGDAGHHPGRRLDQPHPDHGRILTAPGLQTPSGLRRRLQAGNPTLDAAMCCQACCGGSRRPGWGLSVADPLCPGGVVAACSPSMVRVAVSRANSHAAPRANPSSTSVSQWPPR